MHCSPVPRCLRGARAGISASDRQGTTAAAAPNLGFSAFTGVKLLPRFKRLRRDAWRRSRANALKQILFDAYGGFADKRFKNLDKGRLFIVDDRGPGDGDAAGKLFLWFCQIFAEVTDQDTVQITMRGGVPDGPLVAKWFAKNEAEKTNFGREFSVRRGEQDHLAELAAAFRSIVRPGARYPIKSYKYVCPRVAASLDKLRQV